MAMKTKEAIATSKEQKTKWVDVHGLKNPSLHEHIDEVFKNLQRAGWHHAGKITKKAYAQGAVREKGGRVEWNKTRYLSVCREFRRADRAAEERFRAAKSAREASAPPTPPPEKLTDAELMMRKAAAGVRGLIA